MTRTPALTRTPSLTRPPATCYRCKASKVAWVTPRVDYCYACLPGGPFTPPPCALCGSGDYYCQGLCGHCQLRELFICVDGPVLDYPTLAPLVATREL